MLVASIKGTTRVDTRGDKSLVKTRYKGDERGGWKEGWTRRVQLFDAELSAGFFILLLFSSLFVRMSILHFALIPFFRLISLLSFGQL